MILIKASVCFGLSKPIESLTKTITKLAKKNADLGGVCDLSDEAERSRWMARIPLAEIWGVGSASRARLATIGYKSVADVRDLDPRQARRG